MVAHGKGVFEEVADLVSVVGGGNLERSRIILHELVFKRFSSLSTVSTFEA